MLLYYYEEIKLHKNTQTFLAVILSFILLLSQSPINATLQDELNAVQKKLNDLRNQKASIQQQINSNKSVSDQYTSEIYKLKGQIDLLDNQIQEKDLVIQELNLQITILTDNIVSTTSEITKAQADIVYLEGETDKRMVDIYIQEKTFSQIDMFFKEGGSDIIKYSVYQNSIQKETNSLIEELNTKKNELNLKKKDLEANKLQVVSSQTQLDGEKLALTQSQSTLDQKRTDFTKKRNASLQKVTQYSSLYSSMSKQEKDAEANREAIMRVIMARTEAGNGVFVKKGTFLGVEGSTGNSTGAHLHFAVMVGGNIYSDTRNPCDYLPYNAYPGNGDDNCDHKGNGTFSLPIVPTGRLTSGYKPWYRPNHLGVDISSGTGRANILAAHDGYVYYGYESNGWGIFAKVCADRFCSTGTRTVYAHMQCDAEPKGASWRSCNK